MNEIKNAIEDCKKKIDGYRSDYKCWIKECDIEETKLKALEKQLDNNFMEESRLIKNALKPACEKCKFLEIESTIDELYADFEIKYREITINCKNRKVCDMAENLGKNLRDNK